MTATIIDGKAIAAGLRARVAERVAAIAAAGERVPGLALVLVGDNPASRVYVKSKMRLTRETGMRSFDHLLPVSTSQSELLDLVARLNADDAVDGILVQLPLPSGIDSVAVLNAVDPAKDVDGFHPLNAGRLMTGQRALVPCTPKGCMALIRSVQPALAGTACRGGGAVEHRRQADGAAFAGSRLHGDNRAFAHAGSAGHLSSG